MRWGEREKGMGVERTMNMQMWYNVNMCGIWMKEL